MNKEVANVERVDNQLRLKGVWNAEGIASLRLKKIEGLEDLPQAAIIDASDMKIMDLAGAWIIYKLVAQLKLQNISIELKNFTPQQEKLLSLIEERKPDIEKVQQMKAPSQFNSLEELGKQAYDSYQNIFLWFYFIGEIFVSLGRKLSNPILIRWKYLFRVIELNGYHSLPIIGFLSFLIGVVLTYQIGLELKYYGANIFIISLLSLAILREFGPLITAIIVTGRTGSAFTAQLGLMKVNEEVDALQTMGYSPIDLLVVPRVLGLIIAMPLLTVWADIFGIMGGMVMSKSVLGIGYMNFLTLFPKDVTLMTFMIGFIKAPVFAFIIAIVGCYHGLQVRGSSESIGWETTKSVVLAIFLIIVADAFFSIIFSWFNI